MDICLSIGTFPKTDSAVFHFALIAKSTRVLIDWSYEIKRQDYVKNG